MEPIESGQDQGRCSECGEFVPDNSRFCSTECERRYYQGLEAAYDRAVDNQLERSRLDMAEAKRLQFLLECTTFLQSIKEKLGGVL